MTGRIKRAPAADRDTLLERLCVAVVVTCSVLWLCAAPAAAQLADVPGHLYSRERVSLNGAWHYLVDPMERGLRSRDFRRDFPADRTAGPGDPLIEYDWDASPTMQVPGDWNSQVEALQWYEGLVWLRKRFTHTSGTGERVFLYFEGANYVTHVWLDGQKLGIHEGGFTPFAFEVTEHLQEPANDDSTHALVVAVSNVRRDDGVPAADFDWWNYGGLTRPVSLVVVPETYVHDAEISYHRADATQSAGARIDAAVTLDGPAQSGTEVTVAIPELGLSETTRTDAGGRAHLTLRPGDDLALWSPEDPRRYDVAVSTASDRISETIGFRTVEVRGRELLLNGEPLFLRGIALHEEALGETATRTLTPADAERLLTTAKALNANFVRLAHYPHTERMTRLADSLGLLVWSEIPVYWEAINYQSAAVLEKARSMLRTNIDRDYNRASIIFWSVANETPITEDRMQFLRALIQEARARDATRLVSAALKVSHDGGEKVVDDPLGQYLDVLAVNTYVGWYGEALPDAITETTWRTPYAKPMLFSEFGAGAEPGLRGERTERWTEDFQAYFIDETMKMAMEVPFLVGTAPWVLKDFRSPRRWHGAHQAYWNRKGLVGPTGGRKLAFEVLADWYARIARGDVQTATLPDEAGDR